MKVCFLLVYDAVFLFPSIIQLFNQCLVYTMQVTGAICSKACIEECIKSYNENPLLRKKNGNRPPAPSSFLSPTSFICPFLPSFLISPSILPHSPTMHLPFNLLPTSYASSHFPHPSFLPYSTFLLSHCMSPFFIFPDPTQRFLSFYLN